MRTRVWQSSILPICLCAWLLWLGTAPQAALSPAPAPPAAAPSPVPAISQPQAVADGGVWTLESMYIVFYTDGVRERRDLANSSGGTFSHNGAWTSVHGDTYDAKTSLTFAMPRSIPADGKAVISASGTAEWTTAGKIGATDHRRAVLWTGATGPAMENECDPIAYVSENDVQRRTVALAAGPNNCTVKPALVPVGTNQFWMSFSVRTDIQAPGSPQPYLHSLVIWVEALFRFCATATDCRSIEGDVFALPPDGQRYPLIGVPVTLLRNGQVLRQAITEAPDGHYVLNHVPITTSLTLSVTLRNDINSPSPFQVQIGANGQDPLVAVTAPFSTSVQVLVEKQDIGLAPGFHDPPLTLHPAIPLAILDDTGLIYHHTWQAWALTDQVLGQKLDLKPPLEIVAFSVTPPDDGVYYIGPGADGSNAGVQPYINIDVKNSGFRDGGRPKNREWHEFGHYVMADTLGNLLPRYDVGGQADSNHNGFANPSTTDSWVEGFAEFYAMLVAKHIGGDPRPELYSISSDWVENLEANTVAWRHLYRAATNKIQWLEEFAVAGLLWDLVDPIDAGDATRLRGTDYADCIAIHPNTLWDIVATNWHNAPAPVTFSPAAPVGYGYIFDIKQLYEVLQMQGIGAAHSRGRDLTDLEELFIAHGFFADVNNSDSYNAGELIGATGNARWVLRTGDVIPARDVRRSPSPLVDSTIAFSGQDAGSAAPIAIDAFLVEVKFAPPYEHYSYSFQTQPKAPGILHFQAPDKTYDVTTHIMPLAPGYTADSLQITNADWLDLLATSEQDHFLEHTFTLHAVPSLFMPLVRGNGSSQALSGQAAVMRQPVPCLPSGITPTPTATPTRAPLPIIESITPNAAPVGQDVQVTIYGYHFAPFAGAAIGNRTLQDLQYLGPEISPPHRERVQGVLTAGLPQGAHDVAVVRVDGTAGQLTAGFTVLPLATPTATRTPTRTLTPTPTPTLTPTATPAYADDFSDPASGWPTGDSAASRFAYVNGEYQIWLKAADYLAWTTPGLRLTDLRLEVDARRAGVGVGAYGLMFGLSDDTQDYTLLFVDDEGYFLLTRRQQGQWIDLIPWDVSEAIRTDGGINRIALRHQDSDLQIWVNDAPIAALANYAVIPGRVGLTVLSYQEPFDARFDNFRAFDLSTGVGADSALPTGRTDRQATTMIGPARPQ